jgi:hypothetical protein
LSGYRTLKATALSGWFATVETAQQKQDRRKKPGDRLRSCLVSWKRTNPWNKFQIVMAIDNGSIASVQAYRSRYAPIWTSEVRFAPPEAGDEYEITGRAILTTSGEILRIDLVNRGLDITSSPSLPFLHHSCSCVLRMRFLRFENAVAGEQLSKLSAKAFVFDPVSTRVALSASTNVTGQAPLKEIIRIRFSVS